MTSRMIRMAALCGIMALGTLPALAQTVTVTAQAAPAVKGVRRAVVKIAIPNGYHVYGPAEKMGIPTTIALKSPKGVTAKVLYPKAKAYQSRSGTQQVYSGTTMVPVELRAAKGTKGKQKIELEVRTQMCNDRVCLPPVMNVVSVTVGF